MKLNLSAFIVLLAQPRFAVMVSGAPIDIGAGNSL